jgi:LuxR family maltose regulon positive regulatory protein
VRTPVPDLRPIAALRARLHLRQGNLSAVQAWAAATSLTPADELGYVREYEQCILARLLIAQVSQQETAVELHAVFSLLARLLRAAEAGRRTSSMIEILLIQAQAHITDGDLPQSYRALERALRLAQPEGYVQVFVDEGPLLAHLLARMSIPDALQAYVQTILQAFGHPTPVTAAPLVEPLTLREIEILRLIAAGLSNQEIAAQLHLSPQTIKVHTRNIYGKLGVTSRTQAVAQGRALGMV